MLALKYWKITRELGRVAGNFIQASMGKLYYMYILYFQI